MFLKKAMLKNNRVSEAGVAANFDTAPISIHIQRFTGHIYDWSIVNGWPIQKIDLLTLT